jgi:hypothetical protein
MVPGINSGMQLLHVIKLIRVKSNKLKIKFQLIMTLTLKVRTELPILITQNITYETQQQQPSLNESAMVEKPRQS